VDEQKSVWRLVAERVISRKLAVWAVACGLLLAGMISEQTWLWVSAIFVGVEGAEKLAPPVIARAVATLRGVGGKEKGAEGEAKNGG